MDQRLAPPYAGGHDNRTHIDLGALRYFHDAHKCDSLLDVGCGPGGQVEAAQSLGWRALGIDVDPALYRRPGVALIDLCVAPVILPARADVVWSVEVAEHIPPEATANYVQTLCANTGRFLVMTSNQSPGGLHINCRPVEEWERLIEAEGLWLADWARSSVLAYSTMSREFLRETGRVYVRR